MTKRSPWVTTFVPHNLDQGWPPTQSQLIHEMANCEVLFGTLHKLKGHKQSEADSVTEQAKVHSCRS